VQVIGDLGAQVGDASRDAFVYAMSPGTLFVAAIAAFDALIARRYLPTRDPETVLQTTRRSPN
jgi:hypothetical protein